MAAPAFITDVQVSSVLTWPLVNEAVEEAMKAATKTERDPNALEHPFVCQPARSFTSVGGNGKGILLTMPGFVANHQLPSRASGGDRKKCNTLACKLVTSFPGNKNLQPPMSNILANILLFDSETGKLQCIMDGTQITAWRTAAASIVATKYLYLMRWSSSDEPKTIDVAIIGCGVQGRTHALGMCSTFNIRTIYLWNRTLSKAQDLAALLESTRQTFVNPNIKVIVSPSVAECVAEVDVIFTGTYATEPLLYYNMLKRKNIHINAIGAGQVHHSEVGQDIYDHAKVFIDYWAGAKTELSALKAEIVSEVGQVINEACYPTSTVGITIFQSMGMAAEDATVAQAVYEALKMK